MKSPLNALFYETGEVPWDNQCSESIKTRYSKGEGIKVVNGKVPEYYRIILDYGLQLDPTNRQLSFLHVRDLLKAAPKVCMFLYFIKLAESNS
jgi:hypothetical protein